MGKTAFAVAFLLAAFAGDAFAGGTMDEVSARGTLIAGVKNSTPPFGFIAPDTLAVIVGYDVDMAKAVADRLDVKLELVAVTSANRIPFLQKGTIDIIAATMTNTEERSEQIDFSLTYFVTGQKFLAKKGAVRTLEDLAGRKIGTVKGSTSEDNVRKAIPSATIITFSDYPAAFLALEEGLLDAVTTDEIILAALLKRSPHPDKYEIPDLQISTEPYGMGVRKGDAAFLAFVNEALLDLEKSGEAKRIFEKWFGPLAEVPLTRNFTIRE